VGNRRKASLLSRGPSRPSAINIMALAVREITKNLLAAPRKEPQRWQNMDEELLARLLLLRPFFCLVGEAPFEKSDLCVRCVKNGNYRRAGR
jgi:hypothetical protein